MWNVREPTWMETETPNVNETKFSSYAAHDYDPNVLASGPSKHVPSLKISVCGRLCTKHKHTLPLTTRDLCSNLENMQGPAELSRLMKQQLKAQEDKLLARTLGVWVWHRESVKR